MNPRTLILAALLLAGVAAGLWFAQRGGDAPQPMHATVLPAGNELPAFSAVTHTGDPVDAGVFAGQWDLVFFGFTHCPDVCPLTLSLLAEVRSEMAQRGEAPLPRIVLVSVDPERDTPQRLADYVGYFGDANLGITGEPGEIRKLADALGIFFEQTALGDDDYTVDHSTVVLLIDPEGRFRALFSTPHKVEYFVSDLPVIMAQG